MTDSSNTYPPPKRMQLTLDQALDRIRVLNQNTEFDEALYLGERVVEHWPDSADAWNFVGMLRYQTGDKPGGIEAIRRSIEIAPAYMDAHANLGNMLLQARRLTEAEHHLRRALELDPNAFSPSLALSALLRVQARYDEAEQALLPLLELLPNVGHIHQTYANLLAAKGDYARAIEHYRRAGQLTPEITQSQIRIGIMLAYSGQVDKARELFEKLVECDPQDVHAQHMLAAMGGANTPSRAADSYVKDLFDKFSDSFDAKLADLEYRAPELLADLAGELMPGRNGLRVLDAGCGTGLLAPLIHARCAVLDGVDLSPGMLAKAGLRDLYDQLVEAELTAYLRSFPNAYDLVLSADTLCYFGELGEVLAAAAAALVPDGWLLFSVEHSDEQPDGFAIHFSGRYLHRQDYVEHCLRQAGFGRIEVRRATLRHENRKPVMGLLVAAHQHKGPS